jgi:uncharacterized protein (TIGR03435 family)
MKNVFVLCSIAVVICVRAHAQAPDLHVSQWVQAPVGFSGNLHELRGRVVVLEFWATWCEPCVSAIPHLNQLADEFQHNDVIFLALTDDNADRLTPFLAKHPINAIIGVDTERKSWKSFDVPSIPHTVLIGRDGRIIGATLPENITSETLRQALAGNNPALPTKEGIPSDLAWDDHLQWPDGVRPTMYAIIKPIKTLTSGAKPQPGHLTVDGAPLEALVWLAYQTNSFHIDWRMPNDKQTYRAAFRVPEGREDHLFPYMRETLAEMFDIDARWTEQAREVYVLRRIKGRAPLPASSADKEIAQMLRGTMTLRDEPISKLCEMLASSFNAIVLDETGIDGRYDFELPYQPGQPEMTSEALNKLGFETTKARRDIPVLVVSGSSH